MSCNAISIEPAVMDKYYAINPPRHAEAAYQPNQGDKYPTLSAVPTTAGASGDVILLVTTLYNKPIPGRGFIQSRAQIVDYDSLVKYNGGTFPSPEQAQTIINQHPTIVAGDCTGMTPFYSVVRCDANSRVTVRVLTGGTMAKAISREDFQAAGGRI